MVDDFRQPSKKHCLAYLQEPHASGCAQLSLGALIVQQVFSSTAEPLVHMPCEYFGSCLKFFADGFSCLQQHDHTLSALVTDQHQ